MADRRPHDDRGNGHTGVRRRARARWTRQDGDGRCVHRAPEQHVAREARRCDLRDRRAAHWRGWDRRRDAARRHAALARPVERGARRAVRLRARRRRPGHGAELRPRRGRVRVRPHGQARARCHPSRDPRRHRRRTGHDRRSSRRSVKSRVLLLALAAIAAAACGPKRVAPSAPAPTAPPTLIALLPDPETGVTGRAIVTNEFGSVDLDAPRAATRATADAAPHADTISEADVARIFGPALAALPPAPRHFTLYFQFESDTLTEESTALVPDILRAVKELKVPEVVVVGHTDTMGDTNANVALGLKRAMSVRNILITAGLDPGTIDVTSHGEGDLLVKTADNTPEPRNRRVEISVR